MLVIVLFLFAQSTAAEEPLQIEKVAGNVYCLYGPGGNMGILKTGSGLLLIDSKVNHSTEAVLKKIKSFSPAPITHMILTHYHWDHTDGAKTIAKGAVSICHENCKETLIRRAKKTNQDYIATIKTFDKIQKLQVGKEKITLLHLGPGHTSGDTIVIFETSGVIHSGDLFFHGMPPYIDVKEGSDTLNWIRIIETLSKKYPDYKIIPGHGKITGMKNYLYFADYLKYLRKEVSAGIKAGKDAGAIMKENKLDGFKKIKDKGFFTTRKNNILWMYQELTRKKK